MKRLSVAYDASRVRLSSDQVASDQVADPDIHFGRPVQE
jgi:hypothetical protein